MIDTSKKVTSIGDQAGTGKSDESGLDGGKKVRVIAIRGQVPLENWAEIFRCFVNPAHRMNPKRLKLGIDFKIIMPEGQSIDENNPMFKAMKESAKQVNLDLETE